MLGKEGKCTYVGSNGSSLIDYVIERNFLEILQDSMFQIQIFYLIILFSINNLAYNVNNVEEYLDLNILKQSILLIKTIYMSIKLNCRQLKLYKSWMT